MKISVKYIGDVKSNYTRYGLTLPSHSIDIDLVEKLGVSLERAEYIAAQLKADANLQVNIYSGAGEAAKKRKETVIEKAKGLMTGRQKLEKKINVGKKYSTKEDR